MTIANMPLTEAALREAGFFPSFEDAMEDGTSCMDWLSEGEDWGAGMDRTSGHFVIEEMDDDDSDLISIAPGPRFDERCAEAVANWAKKYR